jgi:pimeloyl-ACP methyl ester carboxylesterase
MTTLVFIHGFLDGAAAWDDAVAHLGAQAADALRVDLPGMGARAAEPGPWSLDRCADDVERQARALGRPVVLVGHSMGAQIAELVAGRLGEQVRGLVLLTPVPLRGTGLPAEAMQAFHALGGNAAGQRALRRQLGPGLDDERVERLSRLGDGVAAASVGAFADMWNDGHVTGAQPTRYAGPALLVRGDADPFITAQLFDSGVAARFPGAATATIGQAGHWPHVERPQAFAKVLAGFIATLAPSASQGWTGAFHQKSAAAFAEAFAPDIVLETNVMAAPLAGAEVVKTVLAAASSIYESLTFTEQATNGPRTYLEWEVQAFGGEKWSGVTILTKNADGKIVRAAIHHRPLPNALRFSAEIGRRLQGHVDASLFYRAA